MNTVKSLLNQLCGTTDDVRRKIESQLNKHFVDPFYVSRSQTLPENDILKIDARIISDAFEAVTNGMYDEAVLSELSEVNNDSFFADWKFLTESLYYLYTENFLKADEVFRKIREDSIPSLVSPVFYKIISKDKITSITGLSEAEKYFINNIIKDSISTKTSLEQIEENLKAEQEDRFIDNLTLLLSDLYVKDQNISKKLAAWGLKQLSVFDMSPSMFLENLKLIFGEYESYRLTALSFRDEDPELSLVFFIKAALIQIRNNSAEPFQIEAYSEIIGELLIEIEKTESDSENDDEMTEQINNILTVLEREIKLHYPGLLGDGSIRENIFKSSSEYAGAQIAAFSEISSHIDENTEKEKIISIQTAEKNTDNKNPASTGKKAEKAGNPVQLELFF